MRRFKPKTSEESVSFVNAFDVTLLRPTRAKMDSNCCGTAADHDNQDVVNPTPPAVTLDFTKASERYWAQPENIDQKPTIF